jgi:vitamin B12 transporter
MLLAIPPSEPPAEAILVTGKALPDPVAEKAYQVEIIGSRRLTDAPAHELDEILKQVSGLQLFRRSDSTSGHPTGQGVTLRSLGGNASSRALLVLDGVPQADPFGGWVNWPAYDAAGLDEVRIIRGGGSVTHGSGALAGIIEMRSTVAGGFDASLEGGSRQSVRGHAHLGEELGGGLLALDGQAGRSDGFVPVTGSTRGIADEPAPYREGSVRARWIIPVADKVEAQLGGLAFADSRSRGLPFTGNRTRGADASLRLVGHGRWQWVALGYAQWRNLRSSFASVDDERATASRVSLQDSVPSTGQGAGLEIRPPIGRGIDLRFGADARFTTGESRELYAYVGGQPTRRRIAGGDSATAGVFLDASAERGPLTVNGAVRIDRWRISDGRLRERLLAGEAITRDEAYGSRSGWRPTARVGALIDLGQGASLRGAAYHGWRLPTLNELFRPFRAGSDATAANPLLDLERLSGVEAGARLQRGIIDASVTAFANRLSNPVANVTLGRGPGIFPGVGFVAGDYRQRQNLRAINVRGIEVAGEVRSGPWSMRLGGSFTDARVVANGVSAALDGLRPAQTPGVILSGGVGWESKGRSASIEIRRVGSQYEDDLNRNLLPGATTIDAFASWPLGDKLQLIARGQNLFDETVTAALNDDGSVERATPRTVWLGLRFSSR